MLTIWMRLLCLTALLYGCATFDKDFADNTMAAKIYTDLSRYYWQQGYTQLARDRLTMALQQWPEYPAALALQEQITNHKPQ